MILDNTEYDFVPEFRASLATRQRGVPLRPSTSMTATIASFPPLAQVTHAQESLVRFVVVLDVEEQHAAEPWDIALWHSAAHGAWEELHLLQVTDGEVPSSLHHCQPTRSRLYFSATLDTTSRIDFTVKFRSRPDQPWRWVKDEQGLGDGLVLCQAPNPQGIAYDGLGDIIGGLNPELRIKSAMSQSPDTQLWVVEAAMQSADRDRSAFAHVELGCPWNGPLRWFALARLWSPWLAPRHGKGSFGLESDALMCAFLGPQGHNLVILGISDVNDVTTLLRGSETGAVNIHLRSDNQHKANGIVLAAVGKTFDNALAAAMYHARSVCLQKAAPIDFAVESLAEEIAPQWLESWYDGLGYCTWNALGPDLTGNKIETALDALTKNNIRVSSLIIDDNWQDIERQGQSQYQHRWRGFEADQKSFSDGLKNTISRIRTKNPHIQHVAVWHALLGYWGGVSPNGPLATTYRTVEVQREHSGRPDVPLEGTMTIIAKDDVSRFYNDFYQFLEDCGVDGVKTDAQFMVDMLQSAVDRRELIGEYLDAWVIAGLRHFSLRAISCMSQVPRIMFHEQMPRNRPTLVVRNSDDFYPHVPAAHPWHLWANAHNSLLAQHLNVLPDWDMFQTDHEYGAFHAAARCISGGPIYITDIPGQHNIDLINQISGPTTMGKTVTFRPSVIGKSIDQYNDYHDNTILKVGSYNGRAVTGTPLVGIFNVSSQALTEIMPLSRFPGTVNAMEYIVRSHVTGSISRPAQIDSPAADLIISLGVHGYDILTAYPVKNFCKPSGGSTTIANLGLVGKMTGAAAIMMNDIELVSNGRVLVDTRLMALGTFGLFVSDLASMSIEDDFMITILGQPIPMHVVSKDGLMLRIDVEKAWKEMHLSPGWSNEVGVKVYFTLA